MSSASGEDSRRTHQDHSSHPGRLRLAVEGASGIRVYTGPHHTAPIQISRLGPFGIARFVLLIGNLALAGMALLLGTAVLGIAAGGALIVGGSFPPSRTVCFGGNARSRRKRFCAPNQCLYRGLLADLDRYAGCPGVSFDVIGSRLIPPWGKRLPSSEGSRAPQCPGGRADPGIIDDAGADTDRLFRGRKCSTRGREVIAFSTSTFSLMRWEARHSVRSRGRRARHEVVASTSESTGVLGRGFISGAVHG
jgi:hypothetical protein